MPDVGPAIRQGGREMPNGDTVHFFTVDGSEVVATSADNARRRAAMYLAAAAYLDEQEGL